MVVDGEVVLEMLEEGVFLFFVGGVVECEGFDVVWVELVVEGVEEIV